MDKRCTSLFKDNFHTYRDPDIKRKGTFEGWEILKAQVCLLYC